MKRTFKFILLLFATSATSLPSLVTIACSNLVVDQYVEIFKKYYNKNPNNPYLNFYNITDAKLREKVSDAENQKFNALYDDGTASKTWNDITSLEKDLKETQISSTVTVNIDWNQMYKNVALSQEDKNTALTQQLRFYNILAKLYKKNNILKLVQWVRPVPTQEGSVIAYNEYYTGVNSQTQTYGPLFANKVLINQQYSLGFWSSNAITTVTTHEYGHALSNFFGASSVERDRFNKTYIEINNLTKMQLIIYTINDRTQDLINFLDAAAVNKGIVTLSNNVEKFLLAVLAVSSGYSHSAWEDNNIKERDEFFAEAFAYWMLTPQELRDVRWGLLNDFFIDYVPSFYSL